MLLPHTPVPHTDTNCVTGLISKEQLERGLFELHHRAFLAEEDVRAMAVPFELDDNVDYEA